jgi:acetyltransferase-like isoleucine patch superfamily enzyme
VGKHNIINEICGFGHDTVLHDFVSIMSHSIFGGNVEVGNGCYFGLNTVVINQIKIGEWSVIGAGATVVDDIPPYSLAVGVPARVIKKLDQFDV